MRPFWFQIANQKRIPYSIFESTFVASVYARSFVSVAAQVALSPRVIKWILHARHVDSPAVSPDMWVGCRMLFLTTIWSIVYARPLFSARVRFSNQITWRGFDAAPTYKITFCCRKIFIFHAVGMWYNIEITKVSIQATSLHTIQIIQNGSTLI